MGTSLWYVAAVRAGWAAAVMLVLAAVFTRTGTGVVTGLTAYAGWCGLVALAVPVGYAVLCGLTGWAFLTGFVVNVGGRLTFADGDLRHLVLLLAVPAAVSVVAHGSRV